MSSSAIRAASSAWALVAYLALVLLSAPCTCAAEPVVPADAKACCCGPDAATPCAPADGAGSHEGCGGHLGAGCTHALPETAALDAAPGFPELPAPDALLSFELDAPKRHSLRQARDRSHRLPAPRLDQVRSTVLLI